ncbi:hypothetical protein [Methylobacterium variabile]|jgi:hypothetical protein|uniref:hypothetical protein n=1 Tax=Methylobacterium variabile TaxID=298794 RepID=UPI000A922351|nr:hypothetical protein [Methylobacterium variabile]
MLTKFGAVSLRGLWRDTLTFPEVSDGTLTDFSVALLEMRVVPEGCRADRDDYGWRRVDRGDWARASLTATTAGTGQGTLTVIGPSAVLFYFPAEIMRSQRPGVHEVSISATIGPETAEILREKVVFA